MALPLLLLFGLAAPGCSGRSGPGPAAAPAPPAGPAPVSARTSPEPPPAPGSSDSDVARLVGLVNDHRERIGCGRLLWHEPVAEVARAHSSDMEERDYYAHVTPDGLDPFDRLARAGIFWQGLAGENLALGAGDGEDAFELWLHSPEHRANIETCAYTHHGVGLVNGRWTHLFVQDPLP